MRKLCVAAACSVALLTLSSCETGMHARLDDYGRVTQSDATQFCIAPEGRLKPDAQLCATRPKGDWPPFGVGDCVPLYVFDPRGEVQKIGRSTQCRSN
jgi:hypothetical protein